MRPGQPARAAALPILLLAVAPGCQFLQSEPPPVPVVVRDAETKQPIPGAEVRVSHLKHPAGTGPTGTTGPDGTARLKAAPDGDGDAVVMEGAAGGYLSESKDVTLEVGRAGPAGVVLELDAAPRPAVELVLPAGYRGKVEVHVRAEGTAAPGQRAFSAEVPASGVVDLTGPPVLRHLTPADFRARYADGAPLGTDGPDSAVGFRVVKTLGAVEYFVVGTAADADELRRSLDGEEPGRSGGGGKGGGKRGGGGGRRGGGGGGGRGSPAPG
jgi:hypothetical protein